MGFVNIGGQTVHTSAIGAPVFGTPSISSSVGNSGIISISGTNSSITTSTLSSGQYFTWGGSTISYTMNKITYHVLGEDIQVDGYGDPYLAVTISTLNVLGKPSNKVDSAINSTGVAIPWYTLERLDKLPPNASAIACCPRHTPKIDFVAAYSLINGNNKPDSDGIPGPGDNNILSYPFTASNGISSFLNTSTVALDCSLIN